MANSASFPNPVYAKYVLEPQFEESKQHLFDHMLDANEAHTIMLQECDIVTAQQASSLLLALQQVREEGIETFAYEPQVEDLFFAVEGRLIEIVGPEIGGNLQIARSRNDLAAGMSRLMMRRRLHDLGSQLLELRKTLINVAAEHTESLMPGITHTQPAQPTTFAHYLLGVIGPLERDFERLKLALRHTNQSSFGVAAFTTTSFPIRRERVAELLGLPLYIENGYDAVGAGDHIMESATMMTNMAGSLSRFLYDLLVYSRATENLMRIDDSFIQISSIMPQKRNPVVLEHIRVRIGWIYGEATAVQTMIHSAAFGDTNDVEDPMFIALNRCFDATESVVNLLRAVMESAMFNVELMSSRAHGNHMTTTALADALVQHQGIAFRTAHRIVSELVSRSVADAVDINAALVRHVSQEVTGVALDVTDEFVRKALDPWEFVLVRNLPGGCAPAATISAVDRCRTLLAEDSQYLEDIEASIKQAREQRTSRIAEISGM